MTTIITRLYADDAAAQAVVKELRTAGFPQGNIDVVTKGGARSKTSVADRMKAARVGGASAAAYADKIDDGKALLVVRAEFTPIGAALSAIRIVDKYESIFVGGATANDYVSVQPNRRPSGRAQAGASASGAIGQPSILTESPRFLTGDLGPGKRFLTKDLGPGRRFLTGDLGSGRRFLTGKLGSGRRFLTGDLGPGKRFLTKDLGPGRRFLTGDLGPGRPITEGFGWPMLTKDRPRS